MSREANSKGKQAVGSVPCEDILPPMTLTPLPAGAGAGAGGATPGAGAGPAPGGAGGMVAPEAPTT